MVSEGVNCRHWKHDEVTRSSFFLCPFPFLLPPFANFPKISLRMIFHSNLESSTRFIIIATHSIQLSLDLTLPSTFVSLEWKSFYLIFCRIFSLMIPKLFSPKITSASRRIFNVVHKTRTFSSNFFFLLHFTHSYAVVYAQVCLFDKKKTRQQQQNLISVDECLGTSDMCATIEEKFEQWR